MIKGVNRQILEVTSPESPYFEKIIFFVRPEGAPRDEKQLYAEAEKFSKTAQRPPKTRYSFKQKLQWSLLLMLGLGAGAALTVIMGYLA